MNTKLRTETKNDFENTFLSYVRKHKHIKIIKTDTKKSYLVSEPNCHTTKWFSKSLLALEMEKNKSKNSF